MSTLRIARGMIGVSALRGVLQNNAAPMLIDDSPLIDLFERSKAAETGEVIVQAAISDARGFSVAVDVTHGLRAQLRDYEFQHTADGDSGQSITPVA